MTGTISGCLWAAAICNLVALGAQGAQPNAVRGTVTDASELPVKGAAVTLRNTLTGAAWRAATDAAGGYGFDGVAPGRYWIGASLAGFADAGRAIEVTAGQETKDIGLRLAVETLNQQITVVSSSRVEEARDESPVKVEAAGREQIRDTGRERVSDVLAEMPGVVTRRSATATVGGEQVQGIDSRQVLVLMDGLPLIGARGVKSGALNMNRQAVGPLERVEVVKGAASALYGSDAIGGVINLIPREPRAPVEANVSVSGGSLSALGTRADVESQLGRLTLFGAVGRDQEQAYSLIPASGTTVGPHYGRNDLFFRTRYTLTPRLALGATAAAYHNREQARAVGDSGLSRITSNDSSQNYAVTADALLTGTTTLQVRAYAGRYDENSWTQALANAALAAPANLNERYQRADAALAQSLGARQYLQVGGEWAQDLYRGANRMVGDNAGQKIATRDVWAQDRIQLLGRATLTVGGRYQNHSAFGGYFVPKAGLTVRATDRLTLRAGYGRGFRAPDLGQLYYRFANPTSYYQVIGNPTLRPETSGSASAGATYRWSRVRLGVSLYRNDVSNLIDSLLIGKPVTADDLAGLEKQYGIPASFAPLLGRSMYIYQNLSRIRTEGVEMDGEAKVGRGFGVRGAYTLLDARDTLKNVDLTQRHRHQGFVAGEYANRRRGIAANLRGSLFSSFLLSAATGARAYPYRIWDTYASKSVARGASLYASVNNLWDSTDPKLRLAAPTFDRPDYGRTFRVGVRYTFTAEGK